MQNEGVFCCYCSGKDDEFGENGGDIEIAYGFQILTRLQTSYSEEILSQRRRKKSTKQRTDSQLFPLR